MAKRSTIKNAEKSTSVDLPEKIKILCARVGIPLSKYKNAISRNKEENPRDDSIQLENAGETLRYRGNRMDVRTAEKTISRQNKNGKDRTSYHSLQPGEVDRVKLFFEWLLEIKFKKKISLDAANGGFADCEIHEFRTFLESETGIDTALVRVDLGAAIDVISNDDVQHLLGTYIIYRWMFARTRNVTIEFLSMKKSADNDQFIDVEMYAHATGVVSPDTPHQEPRVEIFRGKLWKFGKSLYLTLSFSNENAINPDKRLRSMQFPEVQIDKQYAHWGIVSGHSTVLKGPIASPVLAVRLNRNTTLDPVYMKRVMRVDPDEFKTKHHGIVEKIMPFLTPNFLTAIEHPTIMRVDNELVMDFLNTHPRLWNEESLWQEGNKPQLTEYQKRQSKKKSS